MPIRLAPGRKAQKYIAAAALAAAVLTSGGCAYIRLLDAKSQLAEFDRYVEVSIGQDLVIDLREPTLTASDIRKLGVHPRSESRVDGEAVWDVALEKVIAKNSREGREGDLHVSFRFDASNRLREIRVPGRYLEAFPPEFIEGMLRSMGSSRVNAFKRVVTARWRGKLDTLDDVSPQGIASAFGAPYRRRSEEGTMYSLYQYTMRRADGTSKTYWVEFAFGEGDGVLRAATTKAVRITFAGAS